MVDSQMRKLGLFKVCADCSISSPRCVKDLENPAMVAALDVIVLVSARGEDKSQIAAHGIVCILVPCGHTRADYPSRSKASTPFTPAEFGCRLVAGCFFPVFKTDQWKGPDYASEGHYDCEAHLLHFG